MKSAFRFCTAICLALCSGGAAASTAGILRGGLPGEDPALVDKLAESIQSAGYQVSEVDAAALCNEASLKELDLVVLSNAAALPVDSVAAVDAYLRAGGDIIALNAPLWQTLLINLGGAWYSHDDYQRSHAGQLPENTLFDFSPESLASWSRSCSEANTPAVYESVEGGPAPGQRALHVQLSDFRGWDTFGIDPIAAPFPPGHTLTIFSAKGSADTHSLSLEWREKDGSRWIAKVDLTPEWRQYVLGPSDFKFWESNPARRADVLHPENVAAVALGLAVSHTGPGGPAQEYWVSALGTAALNDEYARLLNTPQVPRFDLLSPDYKFFDSTQVATMSLLDIGTRQDVASASLVRSPQPRPGAHGFDKGRAWRFMPLVEARTAEGEWRGTPGAMLVHTDGPFKGGQWASFGVGVTAWYTSNEVLGAIRSVAEKMRRGVYVLDAGTNFYTYFEGQSVVQGMNVVSLNERAEGYTARVTLLDGSNTFSLREWPVTVEAGTTLRVSETVSIPSWPENGFTVVAQLLKDGEVVDEARHEAHVWHPKAEKKFITVQNGDFMLDGKRWRANGVNYMPSSGIATEDHPYFEQWLGSRAYDPEIIDRDLAHIVDMGLNSVSIFLYHESMNSQNLLDLLRGLDAHGLKANLSLRPGTPMDFEWDKMREMIEFYRLAENDTVFAYDLAWEPLWMFQKDRRRWDPEWEAWVVERYGSVENAERDWGWPIPRDTEGKVTNPPVEHTDEDGDWRRMTAAYRRCLDTLLYKYYSRARTLVKSVDPNHQVSFRMTEAGDPTMSWRGVMPYDFPYLAAAVDVLEPEAYGRIGDWEKVKPGWFEYEYARWAAPELPMMWAEAGVSAWDLGRMRSTEDKLAFQGHYLDDFYRMMINSSADGIFWWWYPGGFRTGENSDYGIINADGSDRPATAAIRNNARAFLEGPAHRDVSHWIEIDRDLRAEGVPGIYKETGDAFWKALEVGAVPGLKTSGTGTNSATCPLLAVGNTPCNGTNPPKYLDAFFDSVELRGPDGQWIPVSKDGSVQAAAPVVVRVQAMNLAEAEWLSQGEGAVCMTVTVGPNASEVALERNVRQRNVAKFKEIELAKALPEPATVMLSFLAKGRTPFGEKFAFTVVPVK